MKSIQIKAVLLNFTLSRKRENVYKLNLTTGRRVIRVLNLDREKPGRDGKIVNDHMQDGNVARWGPSVISG